MNIVSRLMWLVIGILFAVVAVTSVGQEPSGVCMQFLNAALLCAVLYLLEKIVQGMKNENNQDQEPRG